MTPEEKVELLSRFLDDTLAEGEAARVDELLRTDPEFSRLLYELSVQHTLLHRLARTPEAVPPREGSGRHRALARLLSGRGDRPAVFWRVALPVAACVVLVVAAALYGGRPVPEAPPVVERVPPERPAETSVPEIVREPRPSPPPPGVPRDAVPERPKVQEPQRDLPRPLPAPAREPAPAPPPDSRPVPRETLTAIGSLERVEGEAWSVDPSGTERAAVARSALPPGQGLRTGSTGRASVRYADGTRVELAPLTHVREFDDKPGKRVHLASGAVTAWVPRQPPGHPMVFRTANAESTVLGTRLRLAFSENSTSLFVTEGRVRLARADGKGVDVAAGHFAVASAGTELKARPSRTASGLLALYDFHEGRGSIVHDVSKVGSALDLRIEDPAAVSWVPGGLRVHAPVAITSGRPAAKVAEACKRSSELTAEAWVKPAGATIPNATDPGRIVTLSLDPYNRNFTLEQGEPNVGGGSCFNARLRTSASNANGWPPAFKTPLGTAEPRLLHVVYTRDAAGAARLYVDGIERARGTTAGSFSNWNDSYPLLLADENGGKRPWAGDYRRVAIYARALAADEVSQHFHAGAE